jgi:L-seryl-tRNA(Ser) seleniumtransferase
MTDDRFRALPAVETLVEQVLATDPTQASNGAPAAPRPLIVEAARAVLAAERVALAADAARAPDAPAARLAHVREEAARLARPREERVLNATGVVLHTNLGRAPLSESARRALHAAAGGYVALEYDVPGGRRSERGLGVEAWLTRLTGAEAALVVNNGAAALFLVVSALAAGRKVLVSRGELVEIGGSFRLPDILAKAGATLVEVGTTNRTRVDDYRRALTPEVALLLRVHPSNFRVAGFSERPSRGELAALARGAGLPFVEDVGSGALVDTAEFGLEHEPTVLECLTEGADLVTFSGDKLLGGPQAGLIVGGRAWVHRLKKDPLARALRVDKLTLAALEATLAAYVEPGRARDEVPALALLAAPLHALKERAERIAEALTGTGTAGLVAEVVAEASEVGGGALPGAVLPTYAVAVTAAGRSAAQLERRLRAQAPPLIARIKDDRVLLDARTLLFEDPDEIARVVRAAASGD